MNEAIDSSGLPLRTDTIALMDDLAGCPEPVVERLKKGLLEHLCAPEQRANTLVRLHRPYLLGDQQSIVLRARLERGERHVTVTTILDEAGRVRVMEQ